MGKNKENSFLSKLSIAEHKERVNAAMEELEKMEMGDSKLECYKKTKALIIDSSKAALKAFLWRALILIGVFIIFITAISLTDNDVIQIISFVIMAIFAIYTISPMFPPPFATSQAQLQQMMKKDGVRYKDCTLKEK